MDRLEIEAKLGAVRRMAAELEAELAAVLLSECERLESAFDEESE